MKRADVARRTVGIEASASVRDKPVPTSRDCAAFARTLKRLRNSRGCAAVSKTRIRSPSIRRSANLLRDIPRLRFNRVCSAEVAREVKRPGSRVSFAKRVRAARQRDSEADRPTLAADPDARPVAAFSADERRDAGTAWSRWKR